MAHTAVQENDFNMRINSWEILLPYYFALNMFNYARYGSFYLETLKTIEYNYPGLKPMLVKSGMSIQAQDRHPLRTAIDQRGEQTINRDAKTSGGVKAFATDSSSVLKWCLNRSQQAQNTRELNSVTGLGENTDSYKPLRPSQILKSEEMVSNVQSVLKNEYINPFEVGLDQSKLYNLSSGLPLPNEIADAIIDIPHKGVQLAEEFRERRLVSKTTLFHSPVKRNNYQSSRFVRTTKLKQLKLIETLPISYLSQLRVEKQ